MIVKFINGKNAEPSDLKSILTYVSDSKKTTPELSGGYCCDSKFPYDDMFLTKQLYRKTTGKQYEHYVVSFDPDDNIDADTAFNVVSDIVHHYNFNQAFWAVHTNTEHIHAHVVMNSVNYKDDKFRQWKPQLKIFKNYINSICRKYGINQISKACGRCPVDNVDLLEFTDEEYFKCYGGTKMNTETNDIFYNILPFDMDSTDGWFSYTEEYDDYDCSDNDEYSPADTSEPVRKNPFIDCPKPGNDSPDRSIKQLSECVSAENSSKYKRVFFGDSFNIATTSPEKALDVIRSCKKNSVISAAGVKALINELGDDVECHFGNEFNILLVDDDDTDDPEYIDTDGHYIE